MKAVIMAAGKGTRLLPLTATRPKPMMPILNQPIIDSIVRAVKAAGIDEATVLVDYLSDQIVDIVINAVRILHQRTQIRNCSAEGREICAWSRCGKR